jgi:hypothetical protein
MMFILKLLEIREDQIGYQKDQMHLVGLNKGEQKRRYLQWTAQSASSSLAGLATSQFDRMEKTTMSSNLF